MKVDGAVDRWRALSQRVSSSTAATVREREAVATPSTVDHELESLSAWLSEVDVQLTTDLQQVSSANVDLQLARLDVCIIHSAPLNSSSIWFSVVAGILHKYELFSSSFFVHVL